MKSHVLFVLVLGAATASAADRWWSPDKFYSIIPPSDCKYSKSTAPKDPNGTSHAFTSQDGKSEVRISATYDLDLPDVLPDDVLELGFKNERGVTPIKKIRGKGWDGLRREYTNAEQSKHWLGVAARHGDAAVFLTMMAPEKEFERYRATFEAVVESLQLGQQTSSNQALERTADRREELFSMTSTRNPEAQLAIVSGRSALSR